MIIRLSSDDLEKCQKFANDVVGTNIDCYRQRNQDDIDKIIDDIKVGKLAELACAKLLDARGLTYIDPDFAIYTKKRKSFSADIMGWVDVADGKPHTVWNFHVKCMKATTAAHFGLSWSFQVQDDLIRQPGPNDYLVLCQLEDYQTIDIKTCTLAINISENYWKDPKLNKLHGIKMVLYWSDLEPLETIKKL